MPASWRASAAPAGQLALRALLEAVEVAQGLHLLAEEDATRAVGQFLISFFGGKRVAKVCVSSKSLKALDVRRATYLTYLDCGYNSLKKTDVSKNKKRTHLYCGKTWYAQAHANSEIRLDREDVRNLVQMNYRIAMQDALLGSSTDGQAFALVKLLLLPAHLSEYGLLPEYVLRR